VLNTPPPTRAGSFILNEREQREYNEWCRKEMEEGEAEYLGHSPIYAAFTYVAFVSLSKGLRNGKRRLRRHWKETRLIRYQRGPFMAWHKFPFDVYASEVLGPILEPTQALIDRLPGEAHQG